MTIILYDKIFNVVKKFIKSLHISNSRDFLNFIYIFIIDWLFMAIIIIVYY